MGDTTRDLSLSRSAGALLYSVPSSNLQGRLLVRLLGRESFLSSCILCQQVQLLTATVWYPLAQNTYFYERRNILRPDVLTSSRT